jgi:hypothetical protein
MYLPLFKHSCQLMMPHNICIHMRGCNTLPLRHAVHRRRSSSRSLSGQKGSRQQKGQSSRRALQSKSPSPRSGSCPIAPGREDGVSRQCACVFLCGCACMYVVRAQASISVCVCVCV